MHPCHFYNPEKDSVYNHIFYAANQVPLGDVANSMYLWKDQAFIIVNNSGKIYRVDRGNMEFEGKLTGLSSPRFVTAVQGPEAAKAYISDLYSGKLLQFNPLDVQVNDSIDISGGGSRQSTEQMILQGNRLYVACWSYSDQVMVIDTDTDRIIDSIKVGKQPNSIVMDKNNDLWVLSDGGWAGSPFGHEKASLSRINTVSLEAETMKTWDDINVSPTDLSVNSTGDSLYFIADGVYKVSLEMTGFDKPLIAADGKQIYSLGIDPADGTIYIGNAVDYQQDGWVHRYTSSGSEIDSFRVGVNPCWFCFTPPDN